MGLLYERSVVIATPSSRRKDECVQIVSLVAAPVQRHLQIEFGAGICPEP